jgi:DNA-binding FadR family transcriptional regulator
MLVDRMLSMELSEGDRLESEAWMIEELGVGRGTLREAFRILELSGVLEVRTGPSGGPIVRRPEVQHYGSMSSLFLAMQGATAHEILEASLILAPPMAARAALTRSDEELKALKEALDDELQVGRGDSPGFIRAQANFDDVLVSLGRNRAVQLYLQGNHWITANIWRDLVNVKEVQGAVLRAHRLLYEAIEAEDADRAEYVMRHHLEQSLAYTADKFKATIDLPVRWY